MEQTDPDASLLATAAAIPRLVVECSRSPAHVFPVFTRALLGCCLGLSVKLLRIQVAPCRKDGDDRGSCRPFRAMRQGRTSCICRSAVRLHSLARLYRTRIAEADLETPLSLSIYDLVYELDPCKFCRMQLLLLLQSASRHASFCAGKGDVN